MATLSGVVGEVGDGFIVLSPGTRIKVSSRVRPDDLAAGTVVVVKARLQDKEWIAEGIDVQK
jgi:hypothetical protein